MNYQFDPGSDEKIKDYKSKGYTIIGDIKTPKQFPKENKPIDILFAWDGFLTTVRGYFYKLTFISAKRYEEVKNNSNWNPLEDNEVKKFCDVQGDWYSDSNNLNCIANIYKIYQRVGDTIVGWKYVDVEEERIKDNKDFFLNKLRYTQREGIEDLINYLESSDFFVAPASSKPKYHGCFKGGLLQHSIDVYKLLQERIEEESWSQRLQDSKASIEIIALLHDLCKIDYYYPKYKTTSFTDDMGTIHTSTDTSIIEGYYVEDNYPYGHGEKSVDIISNYIKLTEEEKLAIRWHMGPFSGEQDWNSLKTSIRKYPIVLALFEADIESAYF